MAYEYYPGHPNDSTTATRFGQLSSSTITIINPTVTDYAANGKVRVRILGDQERKEFNIQHIVSTTDRNTLLTYYENTRSTDFEFYCDLDSTNYSICKFMSAPVVEYLAPGLFRVTNVIAEV